MKYKDYIKECSTLFMSALDDILTMFKEKKVDEIRFATPLSLKFVENSITGKDTCPIIKIKCIKNVLYFIDTKDWGHIVGNLSNKMDIFTIYHSVYKHLYEDVNVAQNLQ